MNYLKKNKIMFIIIILITVILISTSALLACDPYWIPTCHNNILLSNASMYNEGWSSTDSNNNTIYSYNQMYDDTWIVRLPDCGNSNDYIYYSYESDMAYGCVHQYTRDAFKDSSSCYYSEVPVLNEYGGYDYYSIWEGVYIGVDYFDWCNAH